VFIILLKFYANLVIQYDSCNVIFANYNEMALIYHNSGSLGQHIAVWSISETYDELVLFLNNESFLKEIHTFKEYLIHMQNPSTDLSNIRDEMLGEVNEFLYLWTLH